MEPGTPEHKAYLRTKLRENIKRKQSSRQSNFCKKQKGKQMRKIHDNIYERCEQLVALMEEEKEDESPITLAKKYRVHKDFSFLYRDYIDIFRSIIKRDVTKNNLPHLKQLIYKRNQIASGRVSNDTGQYQMGAYLAKNFAKVTPIEQ